MANEWRSVCGETPDWTAARRTASASRRRTSDVDSRRPLFERNSAGSARRSSAGRPAVQVGLERPPGRLARGHHPGAPALALHPQLLAVGVQARQVEVHQLLGAQARRVGQLEDGAVAQLQRRGRGHRVRADRATSAGLSTVGRWESCAWARPPGPPGWPPSARRAAARGRRRGSQPACAPPWTSTRPARRARRRSGAGSGGRASRAPGRGAVAHSASCPRSTP